MGLSQFANTVGQILRSDSVGPVCGLSRHISWQFRKVLKGFPVELKISDSRMLVEQPSGVAALVNCMGAYDSNNMNLIKIVLGKMGGSVFDVGANVGVYTLIASEVPYARVVSFEPHPRSYAALVRNIELNQRDNVTPLNVAVSDHEGHVFLTDGSKPEENRVADAQDAGTIRVESRTLDSICRDLNIRPRIAKLDVEGHESRVLMGFQREMASTDILLIENGHEAEIREIMRAGGFEGPWFFHLATKAFLPHPQRRQEDPVYVRRSFTGRIAELGLDVRGGK